MDGSSPDLGGDGRDAGSDAGTSADVNGAPDGSPEADASADVSGVTDSRMDLDASDTRDASPDADGSGSDAVDGPPTHVCGDGTKDPLEDCDLGSANKADAYGRGQCTTLCRNAPYCGDGFRNGVEVCDSAGSAATDLGSCNPECTGYYEKKIIRPTNMFYSTNLGGIAGADTKCQTEFGVGWKALLVGGSRRATVTPYRGDGQQDWVIQKYTHYYNVQDLLVWRTDEIPLLGVRGGARLNLYATVFDNSGNYPWAGWAADWTTLPDSGITGTCAGWTAAPPTGYGSFVLNDLATVAGELCGASSFILCVQQ
jgi:Protein of unknown function (DUF1554)